MNADDIRRKFLDCAKEHGHVIIPRAKVVPENDKTTLFTGSGMQPLLKYLLGEPHPEGTRLADSQTCIRAQDIEEVGDNRHTTFFEMLGNWSLGDYFKEEQITWFFNFLVDEVGLDPNRLYITCFQGDPDNGIPRDDEAAAIWQKLFAERGIEAKTTDMGSEAAGGQRGMKPHVKHDEAYGHHCHPNCDCGRFMEIGNQVFTQYVRTEDGFKLLPKQNVDFGGGLERISAAAIDSPDVFKTSLFTPIIAKLEEISGKKYDDHKQSMRVIADHLRAATFLAVDGVRPSNKQQGYVMRRLIRRAVRFAFGLGVEQNFMEEIVPVVAGIYKADFPEVDEHHDEVVAVLVKEEKAFRQTLRKGLREFDKMSENGLTGTEVFKLYDTYGFPVELSVEEAHKRGINIPEAWQADFNELMNRQRQMSQAAVKKF